TQLVLTLGSSGVPTVGQPYVVNASNAAGALPAFLGIGLSSTSWAGIPLPYNLGALNAAGCFAYTDFLATFNTATNAMGAASGQLTIPNLASLFGTVHFHQWAVFDAVANGLGIVTSGAAKATVGN